MAKKDINNEPFDESTLAKLEIYEDYAEAWIPTFVMAGYKHICIFDFFAGSGYDQLGVPGSPIRILKQIRRFIGHIFNKGTRVTLYLNEYVEKKFLELQKACNTFFDDHPELRRAVEIEYSQEDFKVAFPRLEPFIAKHPSLVYLDQYGVKFLTKEYLLMLEKMQTTDFLYFVSSSHFWRFGDTEEFKKHFAFDIETAKKEPYKFIHRNLLKQLTDILPEHSALRLYPFSLRKGKNIHGIIFGANNIRAIDKFLAIAWKRNSVNGDANFDIDDERSNEQLSMFTERRLTKKEAFGAALRAYIQKQEIVTNKDVFYYTLESGHPRKHAATILGELKKQKLVDYKEVSPKIAYKYIKNDAEIVEIKWTSV